MNVFKLFKSLGRVTQPKNEERKIKNNDLPRLLKINNEVKDINIYTIKNFKQKIDALVFKDKFNNDVGFRIINSKGFNSFGLKEEVDIIFCDIHHQIVDTYTAFRINKFTEFHQTAREVYILAKNMIKYLNIDTKDQVYLAK